MEFRYAISLTLEAHLPFVREYTGDNDLSLTGEEVRFFETLSLTFLPLLETLERLDSDHIPFRLGLSVSPIIMYMLSDEHLIDKYLCYTEKQIEFGRQELERTAGEKTFNELNKLTQFHYDRIVNRKTAFTERYEKNILKALDFYRQKGKLEILASCATNAFIPFISHNQESIQAQIEIPISGYRRHFYSSPQGFWLPGLGWSPAVESFLQSYNFSYTILDAHGLLFGDPAPEKGTFFPARTPNGTYILARDFYAVQEIDQMAKDGIFLDNDRDVGYELSPKLVSRFLSAEGERHKTGYRYWTHSGGNTVYNPQKAFEKTSGYAKKFLDNATARLKEASKHMKEAPICLYANNADYFGRFWHEGMQFIETLFRIACEYKDLQFLCPSEYLYKQDLSSLQVIAPEFSSMEYNGYAETWLDDSNDWIYRHLAHSMERMTELAERFPDDTGLKERALNQAAREILLAQSSDWPALLYKQDSTEYARTQAENSLRNFTTIYEALGSNYISTEWLTNLEKRHNIFPNINYRVFRRKK
ncbi:MAG: DUF1957 domain-containing protein [Treponema sp.]|jgi:1,4-alpha-glucan branching enzyme|nr:DUF1957 domain-containing protein [Treponema sp.]